MMDYSSNSNRWSDYDSISSYSNEGLDTYQSPVKLRPKESLTVPKSERINSYRFSMANLEETQESELDSILNELSLLEQKGELRTRSQTHSRSNSIVSGTNSTISSTVTQTDTRESSRTESPDNDSAFSDTVSLLSSESSASSGLSSLNNINKITTPNQNTIVQDAKSTKIQLALQKLEHASIRRLFVKAFGEDGSSKSLLVDERMNCGFITKLLADKNHVNMEVSWGLIEYMPELYIERLYEDHEQLVENLLQWSTDSKNRVLFIKRPDRVALFLKPEKYLPSFEMAPGTQHDEESRNILLEEFFANNNPISMEGPLYLKSESKKGWKRYHFVLRQSGLYYYPKEKEKVKSSKDLMCLALFNSHNVYKGIGWKKKYKSPTDHAFALKCPKANIPGKGMKMLCAEDPETLEKWIMCCRVAKYGKKLMDNFKGVVEDLAREDLDKIASTRLSFTPINSQDKLSVNGSVQSGRLSCASTSSSSSGCLSDDNNGFESEFTTGTIKRKPTIKPNLPLTSKTRQLIKEVEDQQTRNENNMDTLEKGGTLTRRRGSNSGTLKRQQVTNRCSMDTISKSSSSPMTPDVDFIKTPPSLTPTMEALNMKSNLINSSCMTESMLSLPPPPEPIVDCMTGSTLSLDNLPLPPPPDECVLKEITMNEQQLHFNGIPNKSSPQVIHHDDQRSLAMSSPSLKLKMPTVNGNGVAEAEPIYKTILKPPPYKSPPSMHNNKFSLPPSVPQKSVSFADSSSPPVVLRKKVCFDDQVEKIIVSPRQEKLPPMPPIRDKKTSLTFSSPKRLCESTCNPPEDFWVDLQRVVNKKLSVAQKCKMNLQMTPGEVLGFRDAEPVYETNSYRETSTTNWVIEHYGDNLYENWDGQMNENGVHHPMPANTFVLRDARPLPGHQLSPQRRVSARGPPVPIRNSSTRLSTNSADLQ